MPSDNVILNPGADGATIRTLTDASGETWTASVMCYAITVSPGANILAEVTPSSGLPVAQQGTWDVGITGSVSVTGTFWQTTQPVSISAPVTVDQSTAANLNATVVGTGTFAVQAAQSGSWSVTANAGTNLNTSLLALESGGNLAKLAGTVTSNNVNVVVTDSVPLAVSAAQSGSWNVGITGSVTVAGPIAVTGTFWQTTQPVSSTAANLNATVVQTTAANLNATVVGTGTFAVQATQSGSWNIGTITSITNPVAVTGTFWQTTQPISGTVTANAGIGNFTVVQNTAASLNATVVGTGTFAVQISAALPAGTNVIGHVIVDSGTITTITNNVTIVGTGTFAVQATQAGTWTVTGAGGTFPVTGTVEIGNTPNTIPILANPSDPTSTTGNITTVDLAVSSASGQGGQVILTGTPTASSSVSATLSANSTVDIQITGTWTGTLSFERSMDGGTTYTPCSMILYGVAGATISSVTANAILHLAVGGLTTIRVRATAAITGTAAIIIKSSFGIGSVTALQGGVNPVYAASLAGPILYANFSTSSSGATSIVSAVSGKKVYVLRWRVSANGTTNVNLQSHTTTSLSTEIDYLPQFGSGGGAYCPIGIMATATGEGLDVNNSAAIQISGSITYVQF